MRRSRVRGQWPVVSGDPVETDAASTGSFPLATGALRILLVTYYFPPSGGAGVQRPTKWVRYLPAHGVAPTVLTVRAGAYPHLDPAMAADVPDGVPVVRTPAPDPFALYGRLTGRSRDEAVSARTHRVGADDAFGERVARWVRANVFVPDARVGWVPFAVRAARRLHRAAPFDAVVTTGPPHSAHLVGRALARRGVPWLADFRDPWADIHYVGALARSARADARDRALEASVLSEARAVVTVSEPLARRLRERLATLGADTPVHVVRNGFDPADVNGPAPPVRTDRFEIVYTGTLFGTPTALLDALADEPRAHLRIVGTVPDELAGAVAARGLGARVTVEPTVPHADAVALMRSAALLLLTIEAAWSYADAVVPGKTYEYLASGRPVLGLGPPGEAADILTSTGAGRMLDPNDGPAVRAALAAHVEAWAAGAPVAGAPPSALAPYDRRAQAGELAHLLRAL